MNELAQTVVDYLDSKGIKQQYVAGQLGLPKQGLYQLLRKKSFNTDDANRILEVVGCRISYQIVDLDSK